MKYYDLLCNSQSRIPKSFISLSLSCCSLPFVRYPRRAQKHRQNVVCGNGPSLTNHPLRWLIPTDAIDARTNFRKIIFPPLSMTFIYIYRHPYWYLNFNGIVNETHPYMTSDIIYHFTVRNIGSCPTAPFYVNIWHNFFIFFFCTRLCCLFQPFWLSWAMSSLRYYFAVFWLFSYHINKKYRFLFIAKRPRNVHKCV